MRNYRQGRSIRCNSRFLTSFFRSSLSTVSYPVTLVCIATASRFSKVAVITAMMALSSGQSRQTKPGMPIASIRGPMPVSRPGTTQHKVVMLTINRRAMARVFMCGLVFCSFLPQACKRLAHANVPESTPSSTAHSHQLHGFAVFC